MYRALGSKIISKIMRPMRDKHNTGILEFNIVAFLL